MRLIDGEELKIRNYEELEWAMSTFQIFAYSTTATADASCLGMTNRSAVFGVSAIVEHLYYCSTYILLLVLPIPTAGEICRAFVLMLNTCTTAQQISLPPQYAFKSIPPVGGIEMTVPAFDIVSAASPAIIPVQIKRSYRRDRRI